MLSFTFDTNCIIDIDEKRDSSHFIQEIIAAHRNGTVDAAFVAVSASERQSGDYYLESFSEFQNRLENLGLGDVPHIPGMAYSDISYWDQALWVGPRDVDRERKIHEVLFPSIEFDFADFARSNRLEEITIDGKAARKWRNAWCDRQMVWSHVYHSRGIFVSGDRNFRKLDGHAEFLGLRVRTPEEAAAEITSESNSVCNTGAIRTFPGGLPEFSTLQRGAARRFP